MTPDDRLFAAIDSGYVGAARAAIEAGASVRARDDDGRTPLHRAAMTRRCPNALLDLLIDCGSDVLATDDDGRSPLHYFCWPVATFQQPSIH